MTKVLCPRCGQDYLVHVELLALRRRAILCPECDALWLYETDVGSIVEGGYGVTWFDYETFMRDAGHAPGRFENEIRVLEPLKR